MNEAGSISGQYQRGGLLEAIRDAVGRLGKSPDDVSIEDLAPVGLHLLMKESTPAKVRNMVANIKASLIAPVEIIARKPSRS